MARMITDKSRPLSSATEARQLLRAHRYGVLSTLSKKFDGHPFGSITPYLTDHDGSLLILISTIAEHTKNIQHDAHVSLITHNQNDLNIQTQGRVTVVGMATLAENKEVTGKRYLRYFPAAQTYFAMHDFQFFRIMPQAIRYIGGFGNIHWIKSDNYVVPPYPLIEHEDGVIEHMNADHSDTMRNYCLHFHQMEVSKVTMIGIDCDGFDVRADDKVLRFDFAEPVMDAQQARKLLVEMARISKAPQVAGMRQTAESRNLKISMDCNIDEAYEFLSVPENFPKWASGLGKLHKKDDIWLVDTPDGTMKIRFSERNKFGVLDHWVMPNPNATIYIPMRLVSNGRGCDLIFTLFRLPDMTQQNFDADAEWVMRDLQAARQLLESTK
jgi:putative heme iron utilization protein